MEKGIKKLAGTTFVRNGITFDYCFMECIAALLECCDHVFVVDAGSDDGTCEMIEQLSSAKLTLIKRPKEEWDEQQGTGKTKLCYFTDIALEAAEKAGYEYQIYVQADEVLHEKSYSEVRKAIESGAEAYMCRRINLWKSPYMQINVEPQRMPCSTEVVRLTKTKYRTYGDAESLDVPYADTYFLNGINIMHYGFVRKRDVMKSKIINMQINVFEMSNYDPKLDQAEIFNPDLWFNPQTELKPIDFPHPKIMKEWVKERHYED